MSDQATGAAGLRLPRLPVSASGRHAVADGRGRHEPKTLSHRLQARPKPRSHTGEDCGAIRRLFLMLGNEHRQSEGICETVGQQWITAYSIARRNETTMVERLR